MFKQSEIPEMSKSSELFKIPEQPNYLIKRKNNHRK